MAIRFRNTDGTLGVIARNYGMESRIAGKDATAWERISREEFAERSAGTIDWQTDSGSFDGWFEFRTRLVPVWQPID